MLSRHFSSETPLDRFVHVRASLSPIRRLSVAASIVATKSSLRHLVCAWSWTSEKAAMQSCRRVWHASFLHGCMAGLFVHDTH